MPNHLLCTSLIGISCCPPSPLHPSFHLPPPKSPTTLPPPKFLTTLPPLVHMPSTLSFSFSFHLPPPNPLYPPFPRAHAIHTQLFTLLPPPSPQPPLPSLPSCTCHPHSAFHPPSTSLPATPSTLPSLVHMPSTLSFSPSFHFPPPNPLYPPFPCAHAIHTQLYTHIHDCNYALSLAWLHTCTHTSLHTVVPLPYTTCTCTETIVSSGLAPNHARVSEECSNIVLGCL